MVLDKERSRVLVIGGTGHIGKHIVAASARRGHSTSVLIRDVAPSDPAKMELLKRFTDSGVALIKGDLFDHGSLVNAIKGADIVISAVGPRQLAEQTRIVIAIKEVGNVKRFLPSEFGSDVERVHTVDPAATLCASKVKFRCLIEAEGIPHTYVCCNGFAETYLPSIGDVTAVGAGPPSDKITVLGDGDAKVFVVEEDIAAYTVRAVDDPRTLNKILYMRPPANILSHNELISMWERKVDRTFHVVRIPEADLLKMIKEVAFPMNILLSLALSIFVRGDQANFEIEPSFGVEATKLYPDLRYTTVDEYLDRLL
ncbi:isoflavone reductase homolog IRL isoform X2 [Triticum aestivum]|uniref:isoflavone reductase homolog IRL isoform X2 n=1 Tax=Triticum aestivum TaxID=4565 RepID=UPI001D019BC8|nr:isoflavone reductase homolog IRL-like isoform X2 [Triticum aestivum]